jgi:uncharacterized Zn finger protein
MSGTLCAYCEDAGMIHAEPISMPPSSRWSIGRQLLVSRIGQAWRDDFKTKEQETLFVGMEVMILKGGPEKQLRVGRIVSVMTKYVEVECYVEQEQQSYQKKVHMHSIMVVHCGVKLMMDQNGVLFVERREGAEITRRHQAVSDDEE